MDDIAFTVSSAGLVLFPIT